MAAKSMQMIRHAACKEAAMSPHPRLRAQAGFTLMEVMVAVMLLSIGMASVFTAMFTATHTGERARNRNLAVAAIHCVTEQIMAQSYANIDGWQAKDFNVDWQGNVLSPNQPGSALAPTNVAGRTSVG